MEIMKSFVFDVQRFAAQAITLSATEGNDYWVVTADDTIASAVAVATTSKTDSYIYYNRSTGQFSVTSGTYSFAEGLTVTAVAGVTTFDLTRTTTAGAKVTGFTFAGVVTGSTFTNTADGDVIGLAANADTVNIDGVTYKETGGAAANITLTSKEAPTLAASIEATLSQGKKVTTTNGEIVEAKSGNCVVTGNAVTGLAVGESVKIGDWTYTAYTNYLASTDGTTSNRYKWNGSDAISITANGVTTTEDTILVGGNPAVAITPAPIIVSQYNSDLVLNKVTYYDADGVKTDSKTNASVGVTKTSSGYTVESLKAVNPGTFVQLDKTEANTIKGTIAGIEYELATMTAGPAAAKASARFSVSSGATVKTTAAGAIDVTAGTVSVTDISTVATLDVVVGSSTVTLTPSAASGQTIAKGGVFTKLVPTDAVTAVKTNTGEAAVSLNGVSATLVVTEAQNDNSVLTITTVAGKDVPVLSTGKARTTSKLNYTINTAQTGLAEFSGSGDGVIVNVGDATIANALISDLESGETVKLNDNTGGTAFTTYAVVDKKLEYKSYTAPGTLTAANTKYWTLTGTSVSTTATGVPDASDVTEGIDVSGTKFTFNSSAIVAAANVASTIVDGVYVLKDGSTSLKKDKAVGQFSVKDDVVTYTGDSSAAGQNISVNDLAGTLTWSVVGSGGNDSIVSAGTKAVTVDGSAGNDTIQVSGADADYVIGGAGNDLVTVSGGGDDSIDAGAGNDTVFGAGAGEKVIYGGAGNDLLVHADKKPNDTTPTAGTTASSLVGAEGDDTIIAGMLTDTVVGGAGKDVFAGDFAGITISDYKVSEDVILYNAYGSAAAKLNLTAGNFNSNGTFTNAAGNTIDVSAGTGVTGYYAAVLVDGAGKNKQTVGWTNSDGGTIDGSSLKDNLYLVGNNNDAGDLLKGGSGKDTIYAGNYDSVIGGAGNDEIHLNGATAGAFVGINTSSGKDTVRSFNASFDTEVGDQVFMLEGSAKDISLTLVDGDSDSNIDDVTVKLGTSQMFLKNVTTTAGGVAEVLVSGKKAAVAAANATIAASASDYADFFFGNKSALSFSGVDDSVSVNLGDDTKYRSITTLEGGTGTSTLMGSTGKDVIISAGGETSLWGGAGADTLQGINGKKDTFFFMAGDGKDSIVNFEAYTVDTADTADVLNTNGAAIASAQLTSSGLQIGLNDTDKVTISSITDENSVIQFTQDGKKLNYAKVGKSSSVNTFTYEEYVNAYVGGNQKDVLSVSGDTDAQVWLDGSKGVAYAGIKNIDAVSATGSLILAGAGADETITGGSGSSSLWGGAGNDTLNGTAGSTTYFYGFAEGNDVINVASSASAEDVVNLYNITLAQITGGAIDSGKITVTTAANETLTVNTTKDVTFKLADGSSWRAQMSDKTWQPA